MKMVSQIGLNTSYNPYSAPNAVSAQPKSENNLFSGINPLSSNKIGNYDNDIFMSSLNFCANEPKNIEQVQIQKPESENVETIEVTESHKNQDNTLKEQILMPEKKSNIAKILGFFGGLLAPIAPKTLELIKGGNFKNLFINKQMACTIPVLGVIGLGCGMLIDSCIDSIKSNKSDKS